MRPSWRVWFLPGLLLGVVAGTLLSVSLIRALGPEPATERAVTSRGPLRDEEQATIALFRTASPSVAFITTLTQRVDFWTRSVLEVPQGTPADYDLVLVGAPMWASHAATPALSYLRREAGALGSVGLFLTLAGAPAEKALREMEALAGRTAVATLVLRDKDVRAGAFAEALTSFATALRLSEAA